MLVQRGFLGLAATRQACGMDVPGLSPAQRVEPGADHGARPWSGGRGRALGALILPSPQSLFPLTRIAVLCNDPCGEEGEKCDLESDGRRAPVDGPNPMRTRPQLVSPIVTTVFVPSFVPE